MPTSMTTTSNDELLRLYSGMDVRSYRRMLLGLNHNESDHPDYDTYDTEEEAQQYISGLLGWLRKREHHLFD